MSDILGEGKGRQEETELRREGIDRQEETDIFREENIDKKKLK